VHPKSRAVNRVDVGTRQPDNPYQYLPERLKSRDVVMYRSYQLKQPLEDIRCKRSGLE